MHAANIACTGFLWHMMERLQMAAPSVAACPVQDCTRVRKAKHRPATLQSVTL